MTSVGAWGLLRETFNAWLENKAPRLAAALAYYAIFALAPLFLIAIGIAGLIFDPNEVRNQIVGQFGALIGQDNAQALGEIIRNASASESGGMVATIVGIATLLFAAGALFGELQDALNTVWGVKPRPDRSLWDTVRERFLSFTMVLGSGFLLLVFLIISAALTAVGTFVAGDQFGELAVWKIVNGVVSFAVAALIFALIYKILPDVKIRWSDVWIGAAVTALLFSLGKALIGWYIGRPGTTSVFGAAGGFVAFVLWVYYAAQILFFGAEFTKVYAEHYGSRIQPTANAVAVTEEARARQGIPRKEAVEKSASLQDRKQGRSKSKRRPRR